MYFFGVNGLGIRLPKSLALKVGIEEGSEVELDVEEQGLGHQGT